MFTRMSIVVSMAASIIAGPALAVDSTPSTTYRFKGFSNLKVDGAATVGGLHQACQARFGKIARACTTAEYMLSPKPRYPTEHAWLIPEFIGGGGFATDNFPLAIDFSGHGGSVFQMSCRSWNSNSAAHRGIGVNQNGRIDTQDCDVVRPVTCCKPVR